MTDAEEPLAEASATVPLPARAEGTPQFEQQFHHYTGNRIPWYVRLIWIGFWIFAVYYTVRYLFPDLQVELLAPR